MPHARHRLDLIVVPATLDHAPDPAAFGALGARWATEGRRPEHLVPGATDVRLDLPEHPTLYANQLGGFRVRCGRCGQPVARDFGAAVQAWRRGGDFLLTCPSCAATQGLDEVELSPAGFFARGAIVFVDVTDPVPVEGLLEELEAVLGPSPRVVLRRPV